MSLESKKMTEPVGRMTARDALVYATGEQHASCTVKIKGLVRGGTIAFRCVCNVTLRHRRVAEHHERAAQRARR